ncbi:hypothetical protein [Clavibacter michiganensis]|uniref:hypothetical protein n=1 Tax=Clavibacter michiganensis TaxID=28447 RepID=UPI001BE0E319|nr:hypothetical protein [Clavibacter michiganensis]MBT1636841.1 hypothetical protein [Clavibacter michiganensis]
MTRHLRTTAGVLAAVALLAGCAGAAPSNPDKDAVSQLALDATSPAPGDTEAVVDAWQWSDGWAVLVRGDGKNPQGPYTNWEAYGFEPDGGSWKQTRYELVDSSSTPDRTPHRATCTALAKTQEEAQTCAALDD